MSASTHRSSFRPICVAIVVVASAVRLLFAYTYAATPHPAPDPLLYRHVATNIASGAGYSVGRVGDSTTPYANHPPEPYGQFPPLFPFVLAGLDLIGLQSALAQRQALAIISSAGVLLMALLGRRLGGVAIGVVAATIAALHPLWVQPPGIGMSESIFLVIMPAVVLSAVQLLDRPSVTRALVLGALVGVATLARSESIALLVVLGVPTLLLAVSPWRTRVTFAAALFAGCSVFVVPWIVRNYLRFGGLSLSTQQGAAFGATNCPATYYGPGIGGYDNDCYARGVIAAYMGALRSETNNRNPVHLSRELQRMGFAYIDAHRSRVPLVMVARILRGWGVFATGPQLDYDVRMEGRHRELQMAGQYLHWLLLPLSVVGAVMLPRRCWRRWSVVVAGPILFTLTSAVIYGSVRLRTMAEPSIALFAAMGLIAAVKLTFRVSSQAETLERQATVECPVDQATDILAQLR